MKRRELEGGTELLTTYQPHEGRLYVRQRDLLGPEIYRRNQQARSMDGTNPDVRLALSMSQMDLHQVITEFPGTMRGPPEARRREWEKVARKYPHLVMKQFRPKYLGASIARAIGG